MRIKRWTLANRKDVNSLKDKRTRKDGKPERRHISRQKN